MPGRAPHSLLTPYLDALEAHFQTGMVNVGQLYGEISAKGYKGSKGMVGRWLQARRLLDGEDPVVAATSLPITDTSSAISSSLKLAWLMVLPETKLTERDPAMLKHILQDDVVAQCHRLIHRFRKALHDRDPAEFDQWLQTAEKSSLKQIRSFAKSLRDDYAFIRAAFTSPWSNGHTEGQITRLKFIKRQMYGRASFPLLRQKVLYQPGSQMIRGRAKITVLLPIGPRCQLAPCFAVTGVSLSSFTPVITLPQLSVVIVLSQGKL